MSSRPDRPRTVLLVAHGHTEDRLGGAENCAAFLFQALADDERYQPWLVAGSEDQRHVNTRWARAQGNDRHVLFAPGDYDHFWGRLVDRSTPTGEWAPFLEEVRPDLVHFHHVHGLGYDFLRVTRQSLPDTPIVFTLHDYHAICAVNDMVKRPSGQLCWSASPTACHRCFAGETTGKHHLRQVWIRDNLDSVDVFLSPSDFLRDRHVEWGIPAEKIQVVENGSSPASIAANGARAPSERRRFGFFGQLSKPKGILTLLRSARLLHVRGVEVDVSIHGTHLDRQPPEFRAAFQRELDACPPSVTLHPSYPSDRVHDLMEAVDWVVVPSEWWENSPLVIQEAFACGRPVLCSNIGGMKEKVRDQVDGLHFPVGDAAALAATMERAVITPGLWTQLSEATVSPPDLEQTLTAHHELYDRLLTAPERGDRP